MGQIMMKPGAMTWSPSRSWATPGSDQPMVCLFVEPRTRKSREGVGHTLQVFLSTSGSSECTIASTYCVGAPGRPSQIYQGVSVQIWSLRGQAFSVKFSKCKSGSVCIRGFERFARV